MPPELKRCSQHGLLIPYDGACVLCSRDAQRSLNRVVSRSVLALFLTGVVAAAATLGWRRHQERERAMLQAMKPAIAVLPHLQLEAPMPASTIASDQPRRPARATQDTLPAGAESPGTRPKADRAEREKRVREAMKRVSVKVYVTDWCPVCTEAKAWLRESGISYDEVNIENSDSAKRELKALTGKASIPTFDIEGIIDQGFSPASVTSNIRRAAEKRVAKEDLAGL